MKLLGERVWRYTMVLFTCGDYLGKKTIEQHIEREGEALQWLIDKCRYRYHVFNNKHKSNLSQVALLLEKVDEMVNDNGGHYKVDELTLRSIEEKQREVAERAEIRQRKAEEQRQRLKTLTSEEMKTIPKLQMILLGSRGVGKTSLGNTIFGNKEQDEGERTAHSVARQGFVGKTHITLVDTPGWWKGFPACDTPEVVKEEVMRSMFLCPPGPHVFVLVIDADASFNAKHLEAVTTHMELLGEGVWRHTVIVFTRGDWLGPNTIEQYIEGEGMALQSLVEKCGNRYHVIDNKNADDGTQITELLETITGTVAENDWNHFVPDEKILLTIEEKRRRVEEGALLRQSQVAAKRKALRGSGNKLAELKVMMFGEQTFGKSATGNNLLRQEVFATCQTKHCQMGEGKVADRSITVIDTPGWCKNSSHSTEEVDKEITQGWSMSPEGVHAVLLVVPLDLTFREAQKVAVKENMNLYDANIWKHAMVVFTYGDRLADTSIEEHIEREHGALRWLVEMCENRYHVVNNLKKNDMSQVTEMLEKIEEMVAGNNGQLFCPDMNDIQLRIQEKCRERELKEMMKQWLDTEYRRRELELMIGFRETLLELQTDNKGTVTSTKQKSLKQLLVGDMSKIQARGQKKKDEKEKEENIDAKISQEVEKLNKDIMRSTHLLQNSKEFLVPDMKGDSPVPPITESLSDGESSTSRFDEVLHWLSKQPYGDNHLTLNSQTSGYRSVVPHEIGSDTEEIT